MLQKVTDLKEPPVVGKHYLVPCIRVPNRLRVLYWLPIVGDLHKDPDIGFEDSHWHRDVRFSELIHPPGIVPNRGYDAVELELASVFIDIVPPHYEVVFRRMKCRREMPAFPFRGPTTGVKQPIVEKLEKIFTGRKVLCGKCPHKGMPLESLPKDPDGQVICNGHGLAIDMNKGEVVIRNG